MVENGTVGGATSRTRAVPAIRLGKQQYCTDLLARGSPFARARTVGPQGLQV